MGFLEGRIDEEKLFGDAVFPKTLLPVADDESSTRSLAEMIRTERDSLSMMLQRHGAILFRGFNVETAEEFDRVVQAFGWDDTDLIHGATRIKLTDRVYTANEAPLDQFINFHHEMSLMKSSPSKIFFFCKEPSPEGGETSIVPSHVIVDRMEERLPELMAKVSEVGIIFRFKTVGDNQTDTKTVVNKTWKWILKTDDEVEAKKRIKKTFICSSVNFNTDGSAEFVHGPMNPVREISGKRAWFVPILFGNNSANDSKSSFGDGSMIPLEALRTYRDILEENCVDVKWQKGDILLVDNSAVQHARRPGKPPRSVLVAVCK